MATSGFADYGCDSSAVRGPGKRVTEVPFYVSRNCVLSGRDWIAAGVEIWSSPDYQVKMDYFLRRGNQDLSAPLPKMMQPEMIIA